jgi:hypothetical protein
MERRFEAHRSRCAIRRSDPLAEKRRRLATDLDAGLRDQGQARLEAIGPLEVNRPGIAGGPNS